MWRLRRLKLLDVHPFFYSWCICQGSQISGLTLKQAANIERVQRVAVNIILSDCLTGLSEYSYHEALELLELEPLDVRRERLCLSFAKKTQKSRHFDMFADQHKYDTRTKTQFYEQISKKTILFLTTWQDFWIEVERKIEWLSIFIVLTNVIIGQWV